MSYALISQFRIFAIAETWISSHILYDNKILPSNFIIYHNDRKTRGGGVMDQLISIQTIPSPEDIEMVAVQLTQHSVKLCLVYNLPDSDKLYQQKLISFLSNFIQSVAYGHKHLCIMYCNSVCVYVTIAILYGVR